MTVTVISKTQKGKKIEQLFDCECQIPLSKIYGINQKDLKKTEIRTVEQLIELPHSDQNFRTLGKSVRTFYYALRKRLRITQKTLAKKILEERFSAESVINLVITPFLRRQPLILNGSRHPKKDCARHQTKHRSYNINALRA
jgi:hypothetical protein